MVFIAGAFALSLLNVLVALALSAHLNVSDYYDISMMCGVLGEGSAACREGALDAGFTMLAGLGVCLSLALAFKGRFTPPAEDKVIDEHLAFGLSLLATVLVLGAHVAMEAFSASDFSRTGEIDRFSSFISLENLLWPLLLQFMNSARSVKFRLMYFALLLPIVSLSPYRGVLLSVIIFGVAMPVVAGMTKHNSSRKTLLSKRQLQLGGAMGVLAVILLVFGIYTDTRDRASDLVIGHTQSDFQKKLTQRLAYPLFQAHFAECIGHQERLPTAWEEILHKFRLGHGQNLNEHLFSRVYGEGTVGEMTSLSYGEAAANSMSHPIIWIVTSPILLVVIWHLLRRFGYEVGTLIGIAIWRSSLGGVATVIPALLLQILAVAALSRRHV